MKFLICDSCATGIENDDWTHLDADEDAEEVYARTQEFMERAGWITRTTESQLGYFDCACCDQISIDANVFVGNGDQWVGRFYSLDRGDFVREVYGTLEDVIDQCLDSSMDCHVHPRDPRYDLSGLVCIRARQRENLTREQWIELAEEKFYG